MKSLLCASAALLLPVAVRPGRRAVIFMHVSQPRLAPHTQRRLSFSTPARHNELRLAGLHPGKTRLARVTALHGSHYRRVFPDSADLLAWVDRRSNHVLRVNVDESGLIQTVSVSAIDSLLDERPEAAAVNLSARALATGRGLELGDKRERVIALYGQPNSTGPSTRGARELELLYYAFDWAGSDVPQVMEVYCDRPAGRVVEITLAAPSL
jgi:hypothetical protein